MPFRSKNYCQSRWRIYVSIILFDSWASNDNHFTKTKQTTEIIHVLEWGFILSMQSIGPSKFTNFRDAIPSKIQHPSPMDIILNYLWKWPTSFRFLIAFRFTSSYYIPHNLLIHFEKMLSKRCCCRCCSNLYISLRSIILYYYFVTYIVSGLLFCIQIMCTPTLWTLWLHGNNKTKETFYYVFFLYSSKIVLLGFSLCYKHHMKEYYLNSHITCLVLVFIRLLNWVWNNNILHIKYDVNLYNSSIYGVECRYTRSVCFSSFPKVQRNYFIVWKLSWVEYELMSLPV